MDYLQKSIDTPLKGFVAGAGSVVGAAVLYRLFAEGSPTKTLQKWAIQALKKVPGVEGQIKKENDKILQKLTKAFHVEDGGMKYAAVPEKGLSSKEILDLMESLEAKERPKWEAGKVSGAVYHGGDEHTKLQSAVFSLYSLSNPLHPDIFPSLRKYESEIISMTAAMLHGDDNSCGAVTSGGTESIMLAIKTYRDRARVLHPEITEPEIIIPATAHAAFDKGGQYFCVNVKKIPVKADFTADVDAMKRAITKNTIALVGSAPSYPQGVIDPIRDLAILATSKNLPLHVDACLGGFFLPWAKQLGYPIPDFDLSVPGVTSMSADTHKYGYAVKGTSVLLFSNREIRKYMYFVAPDWTGGIYATPTMAGSRAGALVAASWASLVHMGKEGYLQATDGILKAAEEIKKGVASIPGLHVLGNPLAMIVAFGSDTFDIFTIVDAMGKKGWSLNALQNPSSIHICLTLRHVEHAQEFVRDLAECVAFVKANPKAFTDGIGPIYGFAASVPDKTLVSDMTTSFLDVLLESDTSKLLSKRV